MRFLEGPAPWIYKWRDWVQRGKGSLRKHAQPASDRQTLWAPGSQPSVCGYFHTPLGWPPPRKALPAPPTHLNPIQLPKPTSYIAWTDLPPVAILVNTSSWQLNKYYLNVLSSKVVLSASVFFFLLLLNLLRLCALPYPMKSFHSWA